jgi:superfamily II DNA or RNA helicase
VKTETLSVIPLPDYDVRAVRIANEILARADCFDVAGTTFTMTHFVELRARLGVFAEERGPFRILLWPDPARTSPDAIAAALAIEGVRVAFARGEPQFGATDFLISDGKKFTVLAASLRLLYPELCAETEGGGMVQHILPVDDAAQEVIARFDRCWSEAQPVDEELLTALRRQAEACTTQFVEGDLVRSTNELYEEYGIGIIQKLRNGLAKVEYNPSVFMQPPYRSENKILQHAEIEKVDTPLARALAGNWDEPWRFELKMLAARFLTGNKGGQLSNARTEILPHQIFAAHRVVSSPKRRFLLADEVGLGKTIEAGMIWQALTQRGQAKRTLIITPAGLTTQWQEEMQEKFGQLFEIFGRDFAAENPRIWDLKATAIASLDTLKRKEHKTVLLENRKWNLIIFDESHRLSAMDYGTGKVEKTQNYRLAEEIRQHHYCDALLLLTATPHQGEANHSRFKNLLLLLDDEINFSALDDLPLLAGYGTSFTEYVIRTPKKDVTDSQGHKVFRGRQTHRLPCKMYPTEDQFYNAVAKYIRSGYQMLDRIGDSMQRRAAGFLLTTFQKLNASSTAAIRAALKGRIARLQGEIDGLPAQPDSDEDVDERFEGEYEEEAVLRDDRAILKDEMKMLNDLLGMKVRRDKKLDELLGLMDRIEQESARGVEERVLIFTEYRETQRYLVRELEEKYGKGSVVVIHGSMKLERREELAEAVDTIWAPFAKDGALVAATTKRTSQRLFRDHPRVRFLVSTEAGGEGINLQFCHICVNYDLPWNPMRVEQRVGRIYRFGQTKVVQVYHFFNKGTIEEKVQRYFEDRLEYAASAISKVTGEDPEEIKGSLNGQLESEIEPAKVYQRALVEGNLNKETQQEIAEAVQRAKRAYEIATQSLFRDVSSYSFDSYRRELASDLTLNDLHAFTMRFLAKQRRQVRRQGAFLEFLVPDVLKPFDLPERYQAATFDRKTAIERSDAEFLAIGHPLIDAVLAHVGSYDFGGLTAVRRIEFPALAGRCGFLFVFVVRRRVRDAEECLFEFRPVFVTPSGEVDEEALERAVNQSAAESRQVDGGIPDPSTAYRAARKHLEKTAELWDWSDDVEFIGLSWVEFVPN